MAKQRRGKGEDAFYWAPSKERYIASVSLGYTPAGKRIRKSVTGRTKAEVRLKLRQLHQELEEATVRFSQLPGARGREGLAGEPGP